MLTVGVDLVEIRRIERAMAQHGDRFLQRVYTTQELEHCAGRPAALAARWAAKEAVAKALGTGVGDLRWREIEVWCDDRGKPHIRLHGDASRIAETLGISQMAVSLAHESQYAIAFVVGM